MDFSNNVFRNSVSSKKVSDDTISHTNMVMSCRWGWTSSADAGTGPETTMPISSLASQSSIPPFNNVRAQRFAPCQGRLYHQLLCSHRIRTNLVEDCGTNCVEPFRAKTGLTFFCDECFQEEATKIWDERKSQHNASWPPMEQMTSEQRDQWCEEHRQLEQEYGRDRQAYEMELKANSRPSNVCSTIEASKEEMEFATELDSLSLSLMSSHDGSVPPGQMHPQDRPRLSLPNDASEQLHWNLNTLALDRGSCGVEYSAPQATNNISAAHQMDEDELWRKPRERN